MIISFREGCSGNWLAQLLVLNKEQKVFFRQDLGGMNVPKKIFHFDGNEISHCFDAKNNNVKDTHKIITCHSTEYDLLHRLWPDREIIRISPITKIFRAIALSYYKTHLQTHDIDLAFQYIKDYYVLHTVKDKLPMATEGRIIDFGGIDNVQYIEENFNLRLTDSQKIFLKRYWKLQYQVQPLDENKLSRQISKLSLFDIFNKKISAFNFACYIFIYELENNLLESQRLWTINELNINCSWQDLLTLMEYK